MESSVTAYCMCHVPTIFHSLAHALAPVWNVGACKCWAQHSRIHTLFSRSIADVDGSNRMIWNYIFDAVSFYLRFERRAWEKRTIDGLRRRCRRRRRRTYTGILSEFSLFRCDSIVHFTELGQLGASCRFNGNPLLSALRSIISDIEMEKNVKYAPIEKWCGRCGIGAGHITVISFRLCIRRLLLMMNVLQSTVFF